jgi:hypothetical protein
MPPPDGQGDIDVDPSALAEFASQPLIPGGEMGSPSLEAVAASATTTSGTVNTDQLCLVVQAQPGLMQEGRDLYTAEATSRDQLATYLTDVSEGMDGYKAGVGAIGQLYTQTENQVIGTMNSILPIAVNTPGQDPVFAQAAERGE